MMNCPKCSSLIEDNHTVCLECGTVVAERAISVTVKAVCQKVANFLQRAGAEYTERGGEFLLTRGTAGLVLSVCEFDHYTYLDFHGAIASNIQLTSENEARFYREILTRNITDDLGKFALLNDQVILKYRLIANELSYDTFWHAVDSLLEYADLWDEEVAAMTNGRRHIDAVAVS